MFKFKENANPVGTPQRIEEIENKIVFYCRLWDEQKNKKSFWSTKINMSKVTNFLLFVLDDLVVTASAVSVAGPDKKATVLGAIDRLYDYTVREAMPIWMRPFAGPIKNYIVYVLISNAIDWIVAKYQSGDWKKAQTGALDRVLMLADQRLVLCRSACRGQK